MCDELEKAKTEAFDVSTAEAGDKVTYLYPTNDPGYEVGYVRSSTSYTEGITVHESLTGESTWKQYVSMFFIIKVERNGEVIFYNKDLYTADGKEKTTNA